MVLNVATLNVRGLWDASKCAHLFAEISNLCGDVAAVQETYFFCEADCRVLEDDFVIYSAFGSRLSAGVSLLVGRSFDAIVNVVFAGDGGRLLVTDDAWKTFEFRIAAVYAPNSAAVLSAVGVLPGCLEAGSSRGDWNAILDPNIDRAGRGASGLAKCEGSLFDFLTEFDLIDRYRLVHPGREMWMWLGNSPSGQILNRVLVRRADSDLITCPTFHWLGRTDHKLVRVCLRFVNRPSLASYWKFNTRDMGLCDAAGKPNSEGVSGGGYWE